MTYEQVFKDHSYLWGIGAADDMTGGYVDQEDLYRLLKSPTKQTAKKCLIDQINYWFESGPDIMGKIPSYLDIIEKYPDVKDILERYSPGYTW